MTIRNRSARLAALLASASMLPVLAAPVALAQAESANTPMQQDVITVTARRREESIMDVPLSVTAISGEQLETQGSPDITYVGQTTPNVTLEVSRGTNTTLSAFIRGVGQQDPVAGFEAGVGLYLDDVYLNRPQAAVLDIYDVERIEVLRGPQGTLYGRNTIGGAVKYVTRRLDPDAPTLNARLNIGSYEQIDAIVSGSVPLSDTFRVGGAVASLNRGGYGTNLTTGEDNYNKDVLAFRASAEFEPNDQWFFRLSADTLEDNSAPRQGHRLIPGALTGAPVLNNEFDTRAGLNVIEQNVEASGVSLLAEYRHNDQWTFRNILSYREDDSTTPIDFDSLPSGDLDVPAIYSNDQFSEEFQVLYEGDRLSGVAGFYYLDANASTVFDVLLDTTGTLIGLPGLNAQTFGDVSTETWSVFADVSFDLNDWVSASIGGRYTNDQRSSTVLRRTYIGGFSEFFGGNPTLIATTSNFTGTNEWTDFSPRASLNFTVNDRNSVYFSYSQGFKGGSFDPRGQTSAAPDFNNDGTVSQDEIFQFMSFEPEEVDSYEIGWRVDHGRYRHALAVFFMDYQDVQIPGSVGVDTNGDGINDTFTGVTTNAAAATIQGVEYEGSLLIADDMSGKGDTLSLNWALGLLDGEYDSFINAFGVDISNQVQIQNTPDTTASATLTYTVPVRQGELTLLNTLSYRGDSSQFEIPFPALDQEAFTLWNASAVWDSDDGRWQFGIHGRNLTDERYRVAGYDFVNNATLAPELGLEGTLTAFYGDPRTVTGTIAFHY
ncbi:MAG: TonB-dependent receptor [Rhodobacterales bacterium CG15_BIG_FIL_POST_REV_8_21_14_020_59_13]|nr:MAG: TonB-dependent receptor [Rhodobacterales bacterium CG15_BIG_FIL_POST_REV_8_21_14_020_59_13]